MSAQEAAIQPFIKWQGGKRRLAKRIIPLLPAHKCYVEPFCGGAAILFMRKAAGAIEVINDINGDLINLYRVVQNHKDEFLRQLEWLPVSRQCFEQWADIPAHCLTDIQRAARFYYRGRLAFGGRIENPSFGVSTTARPSLLSAQRLQHLETARKRLEHVTIENLPWQECLKRYDRPHSFFYLDPPYWQTAGYGVPFEWSEFEALAECMRTMQGKALLSINDHPDIRALFADFHLQAVPITYLINRTAPTQAQELIITNYRPAQTAQQALP